MQNVLNTLHFLTGFLQNLTDRLRGRQLTGTERKTLHHRLLADSEGKGGE